MKARMIKSFRGSPNGITIKKYEEGKEYDLKPHLYQAFVHDLSVAVAVEEESVEEDEETKMEAPPSNKKAETEQNKSDKKDEKKDK